MLKIWENILAIFASKNKKPPQPQTIPNEIYNQYINLKYGTTTSKYKSPLPKRPEVRQLREFAKDPVVRRPISIIEDNIVRLPFRIVPKDPNDKNSYKKQIKIANNVILHPNNIHTKKKLDRMLLEDILTLDGAAVEKAVSKDTQRPLYLYPTDGSTMLFLTPYNYVDETDTRYAQSQTITLGYKYFSAQQISYIQKNMFTDKPYGLSPVLQAYQYVLYYLDALSRANDVASNSTADFLIHLKGADEAKGKAFREYMRNEIEGTGTIPATYGNDNSSVETHQIRAINKDGLFLDWQKQLITIVGIAFNCPPEKFGIIAAGDKFTAADLDDMMQKEMIRPYADLMEDFYNDEVLGALGYDSFLKYEYIYETSLADQSKKSQMVDNMYQSDVITRRQAQEALNCVDDNDKFGNLYVSQYKNQLNIDLQNNQQKSAGGFNGQGIVKDTSESGDNNAIKTG